MRLHGADAVFVRARRRDVHPVLADVGGYGDWWPGLSVRAGRRGWLLTHQAPGVWRPHRTWVRVSKERRDLGVDFALTGHLVGEAEWYYLDEVDGVVVHYLLRAHGADRGGTRLLARHRRSVRAALHELKRRLEGDREPGTEPPAWLLADQRRAIAEFEAGVAAHRRQQEQAT